MTERKPHEYLAKAKNQRANPKRKLQGLVRRWAEKKKAQREK